ncbi:hypothetical protein T11_16497 [Trichinella zimbabwensis]|uniref:Uncharacterized protein n=1 Tax=Trichinella zimbabwensis TaxID=268475 RepID=A0A0V1H1L8_9BILA|nr:hypothetical protein T11_16497 [Trichinella zimbabwensis]
MGNPGTASCEGELGPDGVAFPGTGSWVGCLGDVLSIPGFGFDRIGNALDSSMVIVLDGFGVGGVGSCFSSPSAMAVIFSELRCELLVVDPFFGLCNCEAITFYMRRLPPCRFSVELSIRGICHLLLYEVVVACHCMILPLRLVSSGLEFIFFGFEVLCLIHSQQSLLYMLL